MLADRVRCNLVKLSQEPLVEPDGTVLQPDLDAGLAILGLVEYNASIRRCVLFAANINHPLSGFLAAFRLP